MGSVTYRVFRESSLAIPKTPHVQPLFNWSHLVLVKSTLWQHQQSVGDAERRFAQQTERIALFTK
jgi:hypothetical protein